MSTTPATSSPTVLRWPAFEELFARQHRQGEHVAVVGPTGSGKSVLGLNLCRIIGARTADDRRPSRVAVFGTKPRDRTLSALGWPRITGDEWPPGYGKEHVVVWPRYGDPSTVIARHRAIFGKVMRDIFKEGGQTIYLDETSYFEERPPDGLGLGGLVSQYWRAARSLDLTLIAGTQRPRNVSRSMWSEPTWVCIFRIEDADDLRRIGDMGDRRELEAINEQLGGHEFVVVRRPRGGVREYFVSKVGT